MFTSPALLQKIHRFSVCDSNICIGVNPRVVVAPFARRHLWCICAAISVGSQGMVARFARKHFTRGQSAHPKIPLEKFSPSGGVSSGILPSRGILKNIILCRHKTFNPPEGLIPCMPCRGKTYKIPLAFFSICTPAGFNLVENSGGKTQSTPFEGLFFFGCRGVLE